MRWFDSSMVRLFYGMMLLAVTGTSWGGSTWVNITDGFQYKKETVFRTDFEKLTHGNIHLFRIDPAKYRLDIITAGRYGMSGIDAKTMKQKSGAMLAVNGGFFSPEFKSLGLLVSNGMELNKLKWTGWWHVFKIENNLPSLITKQEYALTPATEMAIEAGPRVLVNGSIPAQLKPASAERTAIGIDREGKIIIAVTERLPLTLVELAKHLEANGCVNALNLDGGSSTQLYAKFKGLEIDRPGFGSVANGIGVFQR